MNLDLDKILSGLKILLTYEGKFDQEIIKSFLKKAESKLIQDSAEAPVRKKIFNVMTEALQNISKHQKQSTEPETDAFFTLGFSGLNYYIITGNYIKADKIQVVKSKIDHINSLGIEELKEVYIKARMDSVISEVGGAGLGFIDMARKSANNLKYQFKPIDESQSFFVLMATISNK